MTSRVALIAGASGLVGQHCLDELLQWERYSRVVSLGRRSLERSHAGLTERSHARLTERSHATLTELQVNFDQLDGLGDQLRADDVFCCLGTMMARAGSREAFRAVDFGYPLALARAALARGATQFALVSAVGADPAAWAFYSRVKGELEEALNWLTFRSLLIFRPSLLLGNRAEPRATEAVAKVVLSGLSPVLRGRWRKYRPIHARVVARAMVTVASRDLEGRHVFESDQMLAEFG